jgi:preprotein translocase subunit SecA
LPPEAREKITDLQKWAGDEAHDAAVRTRITEYLFELAKNRYDELERQIEEAKPGLMPQIEKAVALRSFDTLWVEHLSQIEYLRTGIGLRGYGQRDPLVEYKREAYQLFTGLLDSIEKQIVYGIFKLAEAQVASSKTATAPTASLLSRRGVTFSAPAKEMSKGSERAEAELIKEKPRTPGGEKIGRNDPCPCGSGKKYKKCHGV